MTGRIFRVAAGSALLLGLAISTAEARSYHHGHGHHARHHGLHRHQGAMDGNLAGGMRQESGRGGQTGLATWYGPGFHGRKTASGERFNTGALTAAHRSLPFGTRVEVTNMSTGRSVVVRINDRGPHRRGAVIDLSRASASAIGMGGTARVRVARLD